MSIITTWTAPPPGFQDQASRLRALVSAADRAPAPPTAAPVITVPRPPQPERPRAWTIAIASGKGGVGKTNIAVNLALSLAEAGVQTTLLDGDLGLANADLLLGLRSGPHLGDVLAGRRTLDQISVRVAPRLTLVPGASGVAQLASLDARRRHIIRLVIERLELRNRVLILDCGAGIGPGVLSLVAAADQSFVVTTPEPTAIADAYAMIKCAASLRASPDAPPPRLSLLVNQADDFEEGLRVHSRVGAVCDRFLGLRLPLAGVIEMDDAVAAAVRQRRPFVTVAPKSAAAQNVRDLSGTVLRQIGAYKPEASSSGGALTRLLRAIGMRQPAQT